MSRNQKRQPDNSYTGTNGASAASFCLGVGRERVAEFYRLTRRTGFGEGWRGEPGADILRAKGGKAERERRDEVIIIVRASRVESARYIIQRRINFR